MSGLRPMASMHGHDILSDALMCSIPKSEYECTEGLTASMRADLDALLKWATAISDISPDSQPGTLDCCPDLPLGTTGVGVGQSCSSLRSKVCVAEADDQLMVVMCAARFGDTSPPLARRLRKGGVGDSSPNPSLAP